MIDSTLECFPTAISKVLATIQAYLLRQWDQKFTLAEAMDIAKNLGVVFDQGRSVLQTVLPHLFDSLELKS